MTEEAGTLTLRQVTLQLSPTASYNLSYFIKLNHLFHLLFFFLPGLGESILILNFHLPWKHDQNFLC